MGPRPADACFPTGIDDVLGPHHIRIVIVTTTAPYSRFGRHVIHNVAAGRRLFDGLRLRQIAADLLDSQFVEMGISMPRDRTYGIASLPQQAHDGRAEKTAPAGNERVHGRTPPAA